MSAGSTLAGDLDFFNEHRKTEIFSLHWLMTPKQRLRDSNFDLRVLILSRWEAVDMNLICSQENFWKLIKSRKLVMSLVAHRPFLLASQIPIKFRCRWFWLNRHHKRWTPLYPGLIPRLFEIRDPVSIPWSSSWFSWCCWLFLAFRSWILSFCSRDQNWLLHFEVKC